MVDGIGQDENAQGQAGGDEPTPFDRVGEVAGAAKAEVEERLGLGDEERLPWLESADDVDLDEGHDSGRFIGFVVLGLILLAAIVGGIYWATHRGPGVADADGSLIEASREPYKVAPSEAGGKTFEGTGDRSFKVSEGENPSSALAGSNEHPAGTDHAAGAAKPGTSGAAVPGSAAQVQAQASGKPAAAAPSGDTGSVGVQVGAFSTNALAEAAWSKLSSQHDALKGLSHRVVEGKADIGTVYRLQAVAGDAGAANALCGRLQQGGLKCQVKR